MDIEIEKMTIKAAVADEKQNIQEGNPWQKQLELEKLIEKCTEQVLRQLENRD